MKTFAFVQLLVALPIVLAQTRGSISTTDNDASLLRNLRNNKENSVVNKADKKKEMGTTQSRPVTVPVRTTPRPVYVPVPTPTTVDRGDNPGPTPTSWSVVTTSTPTYIVIVEGPNAIAEINDRDGSDGSTVVVPTTPVASPVFSPKTCPSAVSPTYQSMTGSLIMACTTTSDCANFPQQEDGVPCCLYPYCICGSSNVGSSGTVSCTLS